MSKAPKWWAPTNPSRGWSEAQYFARAFASSLFKEDDTFIHTSSAAGFSDWHRMHGQAVHERGAAQWVPWWSGAAMAFSSWYSPLTLAMRRSDAEYDEAQRRIA